MIKSIFKIEVKVIVRVISKFEDWFIYYFFEYLVSFYYGLGFVVDVGDRIVFYY